MTCSEDKPENIKLTGPVFGTAFNIQYTAEDDVNYITQIDSLFDVVNQSLSTYLPNSDISRLNRNEDAVIDEHFKRVFKASKDIYRLTEGTFDPTIGNVVNAWNFGAEKNKFLTQDPRFRDPDSGILRSLIFFYCKN